MAASMRSSNPANKARSAAEMDSIRPMIDAARAKMTTTTMPSSASIASDLDISAEIESEKNRLI